jgi:hypothetical protein
VNDAGAVRVREPEPHLLDERVELINRDRPRPLQPIDQRLSLEELEDDHDPVLVVLTDVEHLRHVIAVDLAGRAGLLLKPFDRGRLGLRVRAQELDRHRPSGPNVLRSKHLSHAPAPQGVDDAVPVRDDGSRLDIQKDSSLVIIFCSLNGRD